MRALYIRFWPGSKNSFVYIKNDKTVLQPLRLSVDALSRSQQKSSDRHKTHCICRIHTSLSDAQLHAVCIQSPRWRMTTEFPIFKLLAQMTTVNVEIAKSRFVPWVYAKHFDPATTLCNTIVKVVCRYIWCEGTLNAKAHPLSNCIVKG